MRWSAPLLYASLVSVSAAATFTWTGAGGNNAYDNPANWSGGIAPPDDGSATLVFGDQGAGTVQLPFFGLLNVSGIQFQGTAPYTFSGLALVNVNNGLSSADSSRVRFAPGIVFAFSGSSQTVDVGPGSLEIAGTVLGNAGLTKTGAGSLVLSGLNLYSGGTRVEGGSLTFTSALSVPNAGSIQSAADAYVGITYNQSVQTSFLDQLDGAAFAGAIGFDTASGQTAPTVFSEQLDLTQLTGIAGLGSQTSARLTGAITVNNGDTYRFSGGAGSLYVESNLTSSTSSLDLRSAFGSPLTLVLRGANTFRGQIDILHSALVLDSSGALSGITASTPARRLNLLGPAYAGYTENFSTTPNGFLGRINTIASPLAIVGIDSANTAAPRTVSDAIDLSEGGTRHDPFYLGTSTRVTLTGDITPTTGDALHLTAIKGGHLTVASTLGGNIPSLVVGQNNSFDPQGGTVELKGANTYAGGTQVLGGTLLANNNAALGLGGVTVADRATLDVGRSIVLTNPLTLSSGSTLSGFGTLAPLGGVTLGDGVRLSPGGDVGIGTLTFNALTLGGGGNLTFNILYPTGNLGTGWDLIRVNGPLTLAASESPFTIDLVTLSGDGTAGSLGVFDPTRNYSWTFVSAFSVNGYSADAFAINSSGFLNNTAGGSFFVAQTATGLSINFTPLPDPSS